MLPELAESLNKKTGTSGTWLFSLSQELSKHNEIELAIACVAGNEFLDKKIGNIQYFCLPGNGKTMLFYHPKLIKYWDIIEKRFNPDIVHIHGSEYTHGISYLRKYKNKKKLLTIQGIIDKTSKHHAGELPLKEILFNRTLKECVKLNGMLERKLLSRRNVRYETEIIKSVSYATGRTDWDKYYMQALNPNLKYFRCNYNLREEFYEAQKWNINSCQRYTIYASTSAQVPMKGGHIVLKAIDIVRKKYPNVKFVFLANNCENGRLIPTSGYTKYISKLIKKFDLQNNVIFIGSQDGNGIIKQMQNANIVVVPSAIENASAVLREAMHIGAPCISAFRGGMPQLINDGYDGFLYDYPDYEMLAGRIIEILSDDSLAIKLSQNAIKSASVWHDKEKNLIDMIKVYKKILED